MANLPQLRFDTKRINEDVPIREVITKYTGVTVPNTNKRTKCPSVNHNDNHPSAAIYGNMCKCFSCGGNFTPLTLAKEQYPDLSFPEVCERLLDDFGLDVYSYSNKAEVEEARRARRENGFHDFFPLSNEELTFIGLSNPKVNEERVYTVEASEYFAFLYGEIPSTAAVYDVNGKEKQFKISERQAIQMEIAPENVKDLCNFKFPTLQQLWKEDKDHVEELLIGKCYETIDDIEGEIEATKQAIEQYLANHSKAEIREAEKMRDGYINILSGGGNVRLTDAQRIKIGEFADFKDKRDYKLSFLNEDREYAETILGKVLEHQKQREEWTLQQTEQAKTNKKTKEWERE